MENKGTNSCMYMKKSIILNVMEGLQIHNILEISQLNNLQ
jgi:hypothetical protein